MAIVSFGIVIVAAIVAARRRREDNRALCYVDFGNAPGAWRV